MRKFLRVIEVFSLVVFVLGFTTCNWMTDTLSLEVQNEVKVATAEEINLYVRFADNNFGTTTPSGSTTKKIDVPFEVSAVPNNNYGFYEWAAFTSEVVNPFKNNPKVLYTNDEDYSKLTKLGSDVVKFEPNGRESTTTTVTILKKVEGIVIVPVVAKRAVLSNRNTYPKVGTDQVVRNQRIVLAFDKEMDFSSFVTYNGSTYDWDKNKIEIKVYDQRGDYVGEDLSYSYFELPVQDENDKKKIIITPSRTNKIPKSASIEIIISYDVCDTAGYNLTDSIEYYYSVGVTDDEGYPIFTEITGGRPREGVQNYYITNETGKQIMKYGNDWSDFYGYRYEGEGNQITELLPEDSLDIASWENTDINKIFNNRVQNSVNLCVVIQDTIDTDQNINKNADIADIANFTVQVKHLVYPDGSEGTGKIYKENAGEYFYDQMRYYEGVTDFEKDSPSYNYRAPEGAFAFTYYIPKDVPDGLLKIELFAEDVTGNSGEDTPYAVYVVKDTSAPKLNLENEGMSQISKIESASEDVLAGSKWYNSTTIDGLKFRAAAPIYDTYGENIVAGKFRIEGNETAESKIYWRFGPSDEMGSIEMEQIDNSGVTPYSLGSLRDVVSTQGAISVHAQLEDDLGNRSEVVKLDLDISYDTVAPSVVTITDLDETDILSDRRYYPLTGTSGNSARIYFTRNAETLMTLVADDSGEAGETDTSSGIAGFFVLEKDFDNENKEERAAKLKVENGTLSGIKNAGLENGSVAHAFAAGANPNASKKDYYLYSVDRALNMSEEPTVISVVQDTTGPGIKVSDTASNAYNAGKEWFKSSDANEEKTLEPGTTGSVKGLVKGTYYYGASDENFPLRVELKDECGEYDSGAYYFKVVREDGEFVSAYGQENPLSSSGEDVNLESGDYKIVAIDNLGNETETAVFHVRQDDTAPIVENLKIHGKEANGTASVEASTERAVTLTFDTKDNTGSENTGVRKIYLKGVDFTGMKVYADDALLSSGTDYFTANEDDYTVIILNYPVDLKSFRIEKLQLADGEGKKVVYAGVSDAVHNKTSEDKSYSIFLDATAPAVSEVTLVSPDEDFEDETKETSTKTSVVSARVQAFDATSGIRRIYINKEETGRSATRYEAPSSDTLLSSTSVAKVNGEIKGYYDSTFKAIVLSEALISDDFVTFEISGVNLPDTSVQGDQTVAVYVFDNSGLRAETPSRDSIIYDTTGPAVEIEDYASSVFEGTTLKKYRSNDEANDIAAVTGNTGRVNGLVTGEYFYSLEEGNRTENPGFKFTVTLKDENITNNVLVSGGKASGIYKFYIDTVNGASTVSGTTAYASGSDIYLTAGTYKIRALDNLGNETVSKEIKVSQDTTSPAVSNLVIHGTEADGTTASVKASTDRAVTLTFNVEDAGSVKTGVRKIYLKGVDFAGMKVYADGSLLTSGTEYFTKAEGSYTVIVFKVPVMSESFRIENVNLIGNEGTKTVYASVSDAVQNKAAEDKSYSIFFDGTAPAVSEVTLVSSDTDSSDASKETSTKTSVVSARVKASDATSGIKRIYVNKVLAADSGSTFAAPSSDTLLSSTSVAKVDGEIKGRYDSTAKAIVLTEPLISGSDVTFEISGVNLPDTSVQGDQTVAVYVFDNSGLRAETPSKDSIIYDTTGPAVEIEDYASSVFEGTALKKYRSNDEANDISAVTGTTGRVDGLVTGKYFYSLEEGTRAVNPGFKFTVTLKDENITNNVLVSVGKVSGNYKFYIDTVNGETTVAGTTAYASGSDIYLTEGTYKIRALDNLGNETVSKEIKVAQDKTSPAVSNLVIHGTEADGTTASVKASTDRAVTLTFNIEDAGTIKTGVRKIYLKGVDFAGMKVYAGGSLLTSGTEYFTKAEGSYTVILFKTPVMSESFRIENINLSGDEGTKTVYAGVSDAVQNKTADDISYSIFFDEKAPLVKQVTLVSPDADYSDTTKETSTKTSVVSARVKVYEAVSGVKRIYVNKVESDPVASSFAAPLTETLLSADSVAKVNGVEKGRYDSTEKAIVLTEPLISTEDVVFEITGVNLPDTSVQGVQTVAVYVFDNSGLRAEAASKDSIIYDTTGPAVEIEDFASSSFDGMSLKKYRSNDTADNISAVTGTTGRVNGLVTGDYYYSLEEGNRAENPGFKFTVTLKDENITNNQLLSDGKTSDIYRFYIDVVNGETTVAGTTAYTSGSDVYLTAGTYQIRALDNLGNETISKNIRVKLDNANPVNVTDLVITGTLKDETTASTTATVTRNVKANFSAGDDASGKENTGIYKITLSGNASFTGAALNVVTESEGVRTVTPLTKKTEEVSDWEYVQVTEDEKVQFLFREPVTARKNYEVSGIVVSESDEKKNFTVSVTDYTENVTDTDGTAWIIKDETAPVVVNKSVVIISTDEDQLDENEPKSKSRVTNDEKVTVQFQVYDILSGIKKITICDDNGNSLLTTGEDGSVLTAEYDGSAVTLANTISADAITFTTAGTQVSESSEKPYTITVTNVAMPKVAGDFVQGTNNFNILAWDDAMNVADTAEQGSIIFDNVPPVPVVNLYASEYFNPTIAYSAHVKINGTTTDGKFSQVLQRTADQNIIWNSTGYAYIAPNGTDEGTDNAGYWKTVYENSATKNDVADFQKLTVSDNPYLLSAVDSIGNTSTPSESTLTKFYVKKDSVGPEITSFIYIDSEGNNLYKDISRTNVWYTNKDTAGFKFTVNDADSGVSYFDISTGNKYYSLKNGNFQKSDSNIRIAEFLSYSKDIEVSVDGHRYYLGGFVTENESDKKINTGVYTSGDSSYKYYAIYNSETGKWTTNDTNEETEYIYFNTYFNSLECFDDYSGYRCYGFYKPLSAGTDHTVIVQGINLSVLEQSTVSMNIYAYDAVNNNNENNGKWVDRKLVYDPVAPEIAAVYFKNTAGGAEQFASDPVLENHNLVIKFAENYYNSYSYSGINKIEVELTSDTANTIASDHSLSGSTDFSIYRLDSDSSNGSVTDPSYYSIEKNVEVVSEGYNKAKLVIKLIDSAQTNTYAYSSSSPVYRYVVIKDLTISGGVDQTETIKVTLTDRAGNVSDNTGNTNNETSIGFDKTEPKMYKTDYDENVQIIDGAPAVSYFKSFLGVPCVLSTHTSGIPYKAGSPKISVLPYPGDDKLDETVWDSGEGTELVLAFNKKGSGVRSIKLSPTCDGRGIFFNKDYVKVWIDNRDGTGKKLLTYGDNNDFSLGTPYGESGKFFQEIQFNSYNNCPRGENAAVYIQGVFFDYTQRQNVSGKYLLWCADAVITSFAGKATSYTGETNGWAICAGLDWDTHEFTKRKITFADSSSSDSSFTDGETIDMTGYIQGKAVPGIFASGLWAINLDNAVFTEDTVFEIYNYWDSTYKWVDELNPNKLGSLTDPVKYKFARDGSDFSKRNIPGDTVIASEFAEFDRNITNPADAKFSLSDDKHTMYLNIPIDPQDDVDDEDKDKDKKFKLSNLKLVTGLSDGDVNISAKLIKYSGLTNDPANRIYVKDPNKNPGDSGKSYDVTRRTKIYYDFDNSLKSDDSSDFADNKTNSITLDTKDPVITWKSPYSSSEKDYRFYPTDATGHTVYYKDVSNLLLNFKLTDASGIKGFYFSDSLNDSSTDTSKYSNTGDTYQIQKFNSSTEGAQSIKYIHVMDNVGHVSSRPVTYLPSETVTPTTWILDKTRPLLKSDIVHHYFDTADEKKYVMKSTSSSAMSVYTNSSAPTSGFFTDKLVEGETGGLESFITETGSGIYGTASNYYLNKIYTDDSGNPNYKWVTENSSFRIMDNVGGYSSGITITQKIDNGKPELSFNSVTSNKGVWPNENITLSSDENDPTILYIGGDEDADYINLILNACDTGDNATGIYKVTSNGTELPVGAAGNESYLSARTDFSTSATTVTWKLGAGEEKTEGTANGLLRSITVTDWVGNENTYWFKLVSDITAPVLDLSGNGPFAAHTYSKTEPYTISNPTGDADKKTGKPLVFFSPSWENYYSTTVTQTVDLSAGALSDITSGLKETGKWYSDEACSSDKEVTEVNFTQTRLSENWTWTYKTPTANPATIYTKDNVGNTYSITFVGATTDDIDEVSAADGKVIFCYASANTAAKINLKTDQIVMDGTEYKTSKSTVGLSSGAARKVYITGTSTNVEFAPDDYNGLSYQYKEGDGEYNTGTRFRSGSKVASITMEAGKTYTVKLYSTKATAIYTEYSFEIIQDASAPVLSFASSTVSNGIKYPSSVTLSALQGSPAVLYLKGTDTNEYHTITLKAKDTGSVGVKSVEAGGDGIVKVTSGDKQTVTSGTATVNATDEMEITFRLGSGENKNEGTANGLVRSLTVTDWLGNASTYWFKLVSDNTAPVYSAAANDLLSAHVYTASEEYVVNSDNYIYIKDTATVTLPVLSDEITGVNGDGWTVKTGTGASISDGKLTVTAGETVELEYKDNVGNSATKTITVNKVSTAPALALAASGAIGDDDYTELTWGSGTYTVYTKASDGKARLKLSPQNVINGFTTYSYAGTESGTVSDGVEIQLPAGTYTFTATDLFNQTAEYTVKVIADTEGPSVSSDILINAPFKYGDKYYCTGASNTEKTAYTFYTKGTDSITVDLSTLAGLLDSGSGFRGWSESDSSCTEKITSVTLPAGSGAVKTIYMWDKVGNTTAVTFTGTRCDSVSLTVTPASGTGIYYDEEAEKIYTNLASVNATVSATGSSVLTYSSNVTEGTATLTAGEEGVAVPYTISVSDVVGNTDSKTINVIKDTEKPNPDSLVFTITKNTTSSSLDSANVESIKSYFDNSDPDNWKLYYNTTQKFYPFFTITGITDALSGPAKIGLNSADNKPKDNFMDVVNGEATNVWGSFNGDNYSKYLYISDKVGNGDEGGKYVKVITGIVDTTGPASVSISGDDAVYFQKKDETYVYNGLGTLSGTDSESGIDTVVVSGNRIVATDKVGNTSDFGEVDSSLGKVNSFEYIAESGRSAAIASEADGDWSDTWAHRYRFTVSGYSSITKIYVLGVDSKDFGCNNLYVGTSHVNLSKTASEHFDNKWLIEINVQNANNLSGDVVVKLYSGYGNCTPANVSIFVAGTKTALNASIFTRAGIAVASAGKAISRTTNALVRTTVESVRRVFVPETETYASAAVEGKSEKVSSVTESVTAVTVPADKKVTRKQKKEIQKAVTNLSERAAAFEKQNGLPEVSQVIGDISENAELDIENTEKVTLTETDNMSASLNKVEISIANSDSDDYNNGNIAKSVVILILSLISLSCVLFILIRIKKSRK